MKEIKIKAYSFHELPETIQHKIYERSGYNEREYFWGYEALKSLEAVLGHIGVTIKDYQINWSCTSHSYIKTYSDYKDTSEYEDFASLVEAMGEYNKETLKGTGDCLFTGYCMDEDVADSIRKDFFNGVTSIKEITDNAIKVFLHLCAKDYEYQVSFECFLESEEYKYNLYNESGDELPV